MSDPINGEERLLKRIAELTAQLAESERQRANYQAAATDYYEAFGPLPTKSERKTLAKARRA